MNVVAVVFRNDQSTHGLRVKPLEKTWPVVHVHAREGKTQAGKTLSRITA
jgi:hypothetical protein